MICPYIVHMVVLQQGMDTQDDEDMTRQQTTEYQVRVPMACKREGCAAWQGGRCQYTHDIDR